MSLRLTFTGSLGYTGSTGQQGPAGEFGGATFYYNFDTATYNEGLANGYVLFNNTSINDANTIAISEVDSTNTNIDGNNNNNNSAGSGNNNSNTMIIMMVIVIVIVIIIIIIINKVVKLDKIGACNS